MLVEKSYQVGGSLEDRHPTYVVREADHLLYNGLKKGDFCYVLNSRQMGKSSLWVRTFQRLSAEGITCAAIDITEIGTLDVTPDKWYLGIVRRLVKEFNLSNKINCIDWWKQYNSLSPLDKFSEFIESVLLRELPQNIVIFIDEIDSIIPLSFKDDFFAFLRACYNKRANNAEYNRLTFCLLGVGTPQDLIADKQRTQFNIGQGIELTGFTFEEAKLSLTEGLAEVTDHPELILQEIINWTGGQPFLTQKLCQLIAKKADSRTPNVEQIIRHHVIENWEYRDEPEHLKTIRDRILRSEQNSARLLGLYQQILESQVTADGSPEQTELQLSGLVVKQDGKLKIYNRIYQEIFNQNWVDKALASLRPYSEAITTWVNSSRLDESRLLRGKALRDAQSWAADKSLNDLDYQFLAASLESEKREVIIALEAEKKASEILAIANETLIEAQQKAKRTIQKALFGLGVISIAAIIAGWGAAYQTKEAVNAGSQKRQAEIAEINALNSTSQALRVSGNQLDALVNSLRAARKLQLLGGTKQLKKEVIRNLQGPLSEVQEYNRLEGHKGWVWDVSFSPDGKTIATVGDDKIVKLWSIHGELIQNLEGHSDRIYAVSFSPDGRKIATSSKDKTVKLWSIDGKLLQTFSGHNESVFSIAFNPQGTILASASKDNTIKLWNLTPSSPLHLPITLKGHSSGVTSLSWSSDGKMLASASFDNTVKLWSIDGEGGKKSTFLKNLKGQNTDVTSVSFSPNGDILATVGADKLVKIWSTNGSLLRTWEGHERGIRSLNFSPNGQILATASEDNTVKIWSLDGSLLTTLKGHRAIIYGLSFSPDGQTIATASADSTVKLWRPDIWLLKNLEVKAPKDREQLVYGVSFSPNSNVVASASRDKMVKLWNLKEEGRRKTEDGRRKTEEAFNYLGGSIIPLFLKGHQEWVYSVSFSPDGSTIASASKDKTVKLWSFGGKLIRSWKAHNDEVFDASFSPDGLIIATASADKTVKLWNKNGDLLRTIAGHSGWVYSVCFSPDGQVIASASADRTVKLWSKNGKLLRTIAEGGGEVNWVTFSPDGRTIALASDDNTVKILTLDGRLLRTLEDHSNKVSRVSFSPNGRFLASSSFDNTVKLWSLDGRLLKTLSGHRDRVYGLSWSSDGKILASGSWDGSVKLWRVEEMAGFAVKSGEMNDRVGELVERTCDRIHDYLRYNLQDTTCN
ncbi:AAA-like domain-containing protein [Kamptonema sp. UHCC 0994]|uniref:WD40 domain-containing protein n=1 Tax=Kamptonema sp. UHCC 0994 TaxID=3031329 RepID=UPI0023B8FD67|nr:AAA-like domain-containing protein [Kamptonema sp. UHCC 0994]MDF0553864.1 AAA-like domain-containing protein [Kamptonema sp. UHCC 0994]